MGYTIVKPVEIVYPLSGFRDLLLASAVWLFFLLPIYRGWGGGYSPPPDKRDLGGYFEINVLRSEMMAEVQSCHQSQFLSWHKEHTSI